MSQIWSKTLVQKGNFFPKAFWGGLNTDRNLYLSKLDRFYLLGSHLTRFLST